MTHELHVAVVLAVPSATLSTGVIGDIGNIEPKGTPVSKRNPSPLPDPLPSALFRKDNATGPCGISIPQLPHATGSGTGATAILNVNSLGRSGALFETSSGNNIGSGSAGIQGDA